MSQKVKHLNISNDELSEAIAKAVSFYDELRDNDWTIERMMKKYPSISTATARRILNKMVSEGKSIVIRVKNPKGGGHINGYRSVKK